MSDATNPERETYRSVVGVLLALAVLALIGLAAGGIYLASPTLLDAAVTLGLTAGLLIGVALTQAARARTRHAIALEEPVSVEVEDEGEEEVAANMEPAGDAVAVAVARRPFVGSWRSVAVRAASWLPDAGERANSRFGTAAAALGATLLIRILSGNPLGSIAITVAGAAVLAR